MRSFWSQLAVASFIFGRPKKIEELNLIKKHQSKQVQRRRQHNKIAKISRRRNRST